MTMLDVLLNAIQFLKGMWLLRKYGACTAVVNASVKLSMTIDGHNLEVDVGASAKGTIVGGSLIEKTEKAFFDISTHAVAILLDAVGRGVGSKVKYTVTGNSGRVRFYKKTEVNK